MPLRQPIVCVLGHVDHGKTSLLDAIRSTKVQGREAGAITQSIGASEIPIGVVKSVCASSLSRLNIAFTIPGILTVDTPGHEAFTNLRRRGGSIADIAILVIDVTKGIERQTDEAIGILREFKTPFVVALNKVDAISGWKSQKGFTCFSDSEKLQQEHVRALLDQKTYELIGALYERGINAERFDRVSDFTKQVVIVPVSAKSREGIGELLLYVSGLAQRFLEKRLTINEGEGGKANILEVREERGFGKTLDIILYEGAIAEGDTLVFSSVDSPVESHAKAILRPKPLDEMRDPKEKFTSVPSATAAVGLKIACENADIAVAGSAVHVISPQDPAYAQKVEAAKESVRREMAELLSSTQNDGIMLKADAFGSLEALSRLLSQEKVAIRTAGIGPVSKKDVFEAASVRSKKPELGVIFAFNVPLDDGVAELAKTEGVQVFTSNIIYTILDGYTQWIDDNKNKARKEAFASLVMPSRLLLLPGCCFRASNPAIFGVEVEAGSVKKGDPLMTEQGAMVGIVRGIQKDKETAESAKRGEQVAISIMGVQYGRQVREKMLLYTAVPDEDAKSLTTKYSQAISESDRELLRHIMAIRAASKP